MLLIHARVSLLKSYELWIFNWKERFRWDEFNFFIGTLQYKAEMSNLMNSKLLIHQIARQAGQKRPSNSNVERERESLPTLAEEFLHWRCILFLTVCSSRWYRMGTRVCALPFEGFPAVNAGETKVSFTLKEKKREREREREVVQQSIYPLAFTFAMVPASDRFDRSSSKIVTSCCWRWLFQSVASDRNLLPASFATALWRYPARASRGYLVEKLDFEGSRVNRRLE